MSNSEEDFRNLVIARIKAMPKGTNISIGGSSTFTKEEILKHLAQKDEIGKKMIEIDKAFFKALKEGSIYNYVQQK